MIENLKMKTENNPNIFIEYNDDLTTCKGRRGFWSRDTDRIYIITIPKSTHV